MPFPEAGRPDRHRARRESTRSGMLCCPNKICPKRTAGQPDRHLNARDCTYGPLNASNFCRPRDFCRLHLAPAGRGRRAHPSRAADRHGPPPRQAPFSWADGRHGPLIHRSDATRLTTAAFSWFDPESIGWNPPTPKGQNNLKSQISNPDNLKPAPRPPPSPRGEHPESRIPNLKSAPTSYPTTGKPHMR